MYTSQNGCRMCCREPEESSSGEVKEPTISSTSSHTTDQLPKAESTSPPPGLQEMPTSTMTEERRVGRPRYMDKSKYSQNNWISVHKIGDFCSLCKYILTQISDFV